MNNPNDTKLVYILMVFIAFTYIPFYIIYSKIIKNRNANELPLESTEE